MNECVFSEHLCVYETYTCIGRKCKRVSKAGSTRTAAAAAPSTSGHAVVADVHPKY